jgi:hypothetical protein
MPNGKPTKAQIDAALSGLPLVGRTIGHHVTDLSANSGTDAANSFRRDYYPVEMKRSLGRRSPLALPEAN